MFQSAPRIRSVVRVVPLPRWRLNAHVSIVAANSKRPTHFALVVGIPFVNRATKNRLSQLGGGARHVRRCWHPKIGSASRVGTRVDWIGDSGVTDEGCSQCGSALVAKCKALRIVWMRRATRRCAGADRRPARRAARRRGEVRRWQDVGPFASHALPGSWQHAAVSRGIHASALAVMISSPSYTSGPFRSRLPAYVTAAPYA